MLFSVSVSDWLVLPATSAWDPARVCDTLPSVSVTWPARPRADSPRPVAAEAPALNRPVRSDGLTLEAAAVPSELWITIGAACSRSCK